MGVQKEGGEANSRFGPNCRLLIATCPGCGDCANNYMGFVESSVSVMNSMKQRAHWDARCVLLSIRGLGGGG